MIRIQKHVSRLKEPTVDRQLVKEPSLIGLGALVPRLLLRGGHLGVHGGRVLGKLTKGHSGVLNRMNVSAGENIGDKMMIRMR
jgi:hypothetical protein